MKNRVSIYAEYISIAGVDFVIPNWNNGQQFFLPYNKIPIDLYLHLHPGFRCFVDVDLTAVSSVQLDIENWRL